MTLRSPPPIRTTSPLKSAELSVVIPTFNERENLAILVPRVQQVFQANDIVGEIIVVCSGSESGRGVVPNPGREVFVGVGGPTRFPFPLPGGCKGGRETGGGKWPGMRWTGGGSMKKVGPGRSRPRP
jgi:hypothetical protein